MYQANAIVRSVFAAAFQKPRRTAAHGPHWPTLVILITGVAAFIAIVLATKFFVDVWSITEAKHLPRWLVRLSGHVSAFGKSGWLLWSLAALLLFCLAAGLRAASRFDRLTLTAVSMRLTFLLAACALPGLLTSILKPLIGRARPLVTGQPDAFFYAPFAYFREALFGTMAFPEYFYGSMPSGHATNVFAIAIAFGALWPRLRPLLWAFALVIAATRLTIAVHHPTDVMVGAAIGAFGALAIRNYFAARRWVFAVDMEGRVRAMPGPGLRRLAGVFVRLWTTARTVPPASSLGGANARAPS